MQWGLGAVIVDRRRSSGPVDDPDGQARARRCARHRDVAAASAADVRHRDERRSTRRSCDGQLDDCRLAAERARAASTILFMVDQAARGDSARRGTLSAMTSEGYRVAVVGATGQVGTLMLRAAARARVPGARDRAVRLRALGRARARGRAASCRRSSEETIQGFDLALFSAGGSTSGEWAPRFAEAGAVVVDNSSRWRMHDDVPLVVSEVNPEALAAPPRDRRQPELLDDADGRRAEAAPRRGRDRAARDLAPTRRSRAPASAAVDELLDQSHALLHEREIAPARAPTRTRSPSTRSPTPASSPPARTTPTRSAS